MYRPGSGGYGDRYDDDRYESRSGNRDDDRNGYGRERDPRDDDRYGRYGESYGREGDRNSRDNEERYGRDGYKDDEYRGRGQSIDDYQYGSRSRSADRERSQANEDDGQYSSRFVELPYRKSQIKFCSKFFRINFSWSLLCIDTG